jgi:hypothetical protein
VRTVLCLCALLTGCFYLDPVNRKPEIFGISCEAEEGKRQCLRSVHRGDLLVFEADFSDYEHREATASFDWKAFQCMDSATKECVEAPIGIARTQAFTLEVPKTLRDVRMIKVALDLRDELGASVTRTERYPVNDPPTLDAEPPPDGIVVGAPVSLYATVGDLDEGPDRLDVRWDVIAPVPSAVPLEDLPVPPPRDPALRTYGKLLVPDRTGQWDVRVRATDTLPEVPETEEQHLTFTVGPDQPPCLAQSLPQVPPDGASVPVSEPTLFQVAVVVDDLDPYPPPPGPHFGATVFEWSILAPGSPGRQVLTGATGNSVDFDPGAFTPGEIIELRVEIFDRNDTAIPCADGAATCAISRPTCIQRQTWRVEVR